MSTHSTRSTRQQRRQAKASRRQRRRLQARRARATRRRLQHLHQQLPAPVQSLLDCLSPAFTHPTFLRFAFLLVAVLLTVGARTVVNLLRTLDALAPGDPSSYHRVFSKRRWHPWRLARGLATWLLQHLLAEGPIVLAGDDTVEEHPGTHVYGKGCHRDPVRSTKSFTAFRWGHKWVVLTALVPFAFATRPWALPLLVALYRPEEVNRQEGRRHKTPSQLLRQLLRLLQRWFPDRTFICAADGNYATHELARSAARRPQQLTYVSKFYPNANLYAPPRRPAPTAKKPVGRPPEKGKKLPSPEQVVARCRRRRRLNVAWYGGGRRDVAVVTGTGLWYQSGEGVVRVRWVFVEDRTGTHRDEYFFTTDLSMSVQAVIETYTRRWNIETTFEELRAYLGLETTRGWCQQTVLRAAPCLFGLYTVVAVLYSQLPRRYAAVRVVRWRGKQDVTFSDAITAVRRWLWVEWVFTIPGHDEAFRKLSPPFRAMLLNGLAPAA